MCVVDRLSLMVFLGLGVITLFFAIVFSTISLYSWRFPAQN